jgi:methanogenic corrinoid protein MtbC1/DNA-binding XRE family transcriptional regulator
MRRATERPRRNHSGNDEPGERAPRQNGYLKTLLEGNDEAAQDLIDRLVQDGLTSPEIYLHVLAPAMERIGDLWCDGHINAAHEHLATQITLAQMEKMRSFMSPAPLSGPRALIACAQCEQHLIGARMAADLFMLDGWRVDFLGADVPASNLVELVDERRPHVVGLSVTLKQNLKYAWRAIEGIAGLSAAPKIILSGQAALRRPLNQSTKRFCAVANDATEGVRLARTLLNTETPKAVLHEYLAELGRRVRELRNRRGWTQQSLAAATRLTRAYLVAVEGGKQNVTLDVVIRIANALGVPPDRLLSSQRAGPGRPPEGVSSEKP